MEVCEPIDNPGWTEARMLTQHPEFVEEAPWRLVAARRSDVRLAPMLAQMAAEGRLSDPTMLGEGQGDFSVYTPIENPGRVEATVLEQHPDWVERFPWRIMWCRKRDENRATKDL